MPAWLTWLATHVGLGSVKNATGIRKDLVDTKKAKKEIEKLDRELDPPRVQPATFEDVQKYDLKVQALQAKVAEIQSQDGGRIRKVSLIWQLIILIIFVLFMLLFGLAYFIRIDLPINK